MSAQPKPLLPYSAMRDELAERGISEWEFRQLLDAKVLVGKPNRPGGRKYYRWADVEKKILTPAEEPPVPNGQKQQQTPNAQRSTSNGSSQKGKR